MKHSSIDLARINHRLTESRHIGSTIKLRTIHIFTTLILRQKRQIKRRGEIKDGRGASQEITRTFLQQKSLRSRAVSRGPARPEEDSRLPWADKKTREVREGDRRTREKWESEVVASAQEDYREKTAGVEGENDDDGDDDDNDGGRGYKADGTRVSSSTF